MSRIQRPEDFFSTEARDYEPYEGMSKNDVLSLLRTYGNHIKEQCLDWAASKAQLGVFYRSGASVDGSNDTLQHTREEVILDDCGWSKSIAKVHREGILEGKTDKELLI